MDQKQCPKCNCKEIKQGVFEPNAKLIAMGSILTMGNTTDVIAEVCPKCGHILELKVGNPTIFK
ncbi:hypothetical protein IRP63_02615 [Clostridium botulinum]|uniref:Transcription initiation factor TFIIIB n=1 Tax=Clostridium botulinum C/D str. DC5 TaxID=1443128 RepID=A0A0A0IGH5_CLOBO|nr:hypothetical protein [Clostridium botulinum]KGM99658.1 hypothetical protein Z955_06475 [Clostridium botulinum C/D str. DC5]KOC51601.1 hypothetical protein ADU89_13190 [Clostridium botulinum]KOC53484.1 hypothetical protein ADU90_13480 [Clostridium botulinum]MCD3234639.1 hypothetical protein [Clostridium botulinum D/C]MCD3240476.1 hypothetical protein [Clostridium botulinum D/C]